MNDILLRCSYLLTKICAYIWLVCMRTVTLSRNKIQKRNIDNFELSPYISCVADKLSNKIWAPKANEQNEQVRKSSNRYRYYSVVNNRQLRSLAFDSHTRLESSLHTRLVLCEILTMFVFLYQFFFLETPNQRMCRIYREEQTLASRCEHNCTHPLINQWRNHLY